MESTLKNSTRRKKAPGPAKTRSDAKLLHLPEEKRVLILKWMNEEGAAACVKRIEKELEITVSKSGVYASLAKWRAEEEYARYYHKARAYAECEAKEKGFTPEQQEEATDRNFIMLAADTKNVEQYLQLRYLRIADQKAKRQSRVAETKLKQGARALEQKDKALQLADRRVTLLAQKIEEAKKATQSETLSAEERAQRVREILGD